MMIDLEREPLVPLYQAGDLFPTPPAVATIWRWVRHGINGHRLEIVRVGHRTYTTAAAVRRFIEAQNERTEPESVAV